MGGTPWARCNFSTRAHRAPRLHISLTEGQESLLSVGQRGETRLYEGVPHGPVTTFRHGPIGHPPLIPLREGQENFVSL